ncbi:MAG: hypothetical protein CFE43_06790 [Burkholderiales bacterium PBB3]|nr:MAG: hypothetical protein CFE43_06790 [Burkholderiales bacterium PBB3]
MKKFLAIALSLAALAPAFAQPSVGVSIGINQPGVYGRINIGNFPQPQLVYAQPVIITRPAHYVRQQPLYLYVPPGHQQNWRKYCGRYSACGQPVYFVKEQWVRERYEERHRHDDHRGPRGHDRDRDWDRGNGHGR